MLSMLQHCSKPFCKDSNSLRVPCHRTTTRLLTLVGRRVSRSLPYLLCNPNSYLESKACNLPIWRL